MRMRIITSLAICAALTPSSPKASSVDIKGLFAAGIIKPSEQAVNRIETYQLPLVPLAVGSQKALDRALLDSNDEALDEEFSQLVAAQGIDRGAEQILSWGVTRHLAGYLGASERFGRDLDFIGVLTKRPEYVKASVGVWFYLYAVALVDGHKCTDPSAPRQFMVKTNEAYHLGATKLEHASLVRLASDAASLEALTAPDRVSDPTVCLAGTAGADMKPSADWQAKAGQTRLALPATLRALANWLHSHRPRQVQKWFDEDLVASRIDLHAELEKINVDATRLDTAALFNGASMALRLRKVISSTQDRYGVVSTRRSSLRLATRPKRSLPSIKLSAR